MLRADHVGVLLGVVEQQAAALGLQLGQPPLDLPNPALDQRNLVLATQLRAQGACLRAQVHQVHA